MKGLGGSGRYVRRICIDTVRGNNVHRNEIVLLGSRTGGGGGGGGGERVKARRTQAPTRKTEDAVDRRQNNKNAN